MTMRAPRFHLLAVTSTVESRHLTHCSSRRAFNRPNRCSSRTNHFLSTVFPTTFPLHFVLICIAMHRKPSVSLPLGSPRFSSFTLLSFFFLAFFAPSFYSRRLFFCLLDRCYNLSSPFTLKNVSLILSLRLSIYIYSFASHTHTDFQGFFVVLSLSLCLRTRTYIYKTVSSKDRMY